MLSSFRNWLYIYLAFFTHVFKVRQNKSITDWKLTLVNSFQASDLTFKILLIYITISLKSLLYPLVKKKKKKKKKRFSFYSRLSWNAIYPKNSFAVRFYFTYLETFPIL